jgi:hypothetical protein
MIGSSMAGTSVIGSSVDSTSVMDSDYTSRDGGVQLNPRRPCTGGTQSQQRAYNDYDSDDDDDVMAEGYSECN